MRDLTGYLCIKKCSSLFTRYKQSGSCWNRTRSKWLVMWYTVYIWLEMDRHFPTHPAGCKRVPESCSLIPLATFMSMFVWSGSVRRVTAGAASNWAKNGCRLPSLSQHKQYCLFLPFSIHVILSKIKKCARNLNIGLLLKKLSLFGMLILTTKQVCLNWKFLVKTCS